MAIVNPYAIPTDPEVSLKSNWLTVNKRTLRADILEFSKNTNKLPVSPQQLEASIQLGRHAILSKVPENGPIWLAQLGSTEQTDPENSEVFTKAGHENGGVNTSIEEIKEVFHPFWNSVHRSGFMPEVRRISGETDGGAWLLLRRPTIPEVLHNWLEYDESEEARALRERIEANHQLGRLSIDAYRRASERHIDEQRDGPRSRQQIGLILAVSAIKKTLEDFDGYQIEADDALVYATNDQGIDRATVFAIENSLADTR